jgi:membrane protein DedA with SNARE-associated domain
MAIDLKSRRTRRLALILFVLVALPTLLFGLRTYRSLQLLHSAYELGAPKTSSIRGWMTLQYVAITYRAPEVALGERLGLPPNTDPNTSLKTLADQSKISPPEFVQRVQRAVAELAADASADRNSPTSGWFGVISDEVLTGLLVYGYPVLAVTLLLGAIGLPLPDGLAMAVAGSLAAQGRMDWLWAGAIAVIASVLGDAVAYGMGRLLGRDVLERQARWLGYTRARRDRVQALFHQWGSLTVFITRTFVSYLSSVASLLAGMSHFDISKFLAIAFTGRVVWAAAYLDLGYAIGADFEAAAGFLTNLSVLLLSLMVLAASGLVASGGIVIFAHRIPK